MCDKFWRKKIPSGNKKKSPNASENDWCVHIEKSVKLWMYMYEICSNGQWNGNKNSQRKKSREKTTLFLIHGLEIFGDICCCHIHKQKSFELQLQNYFYTVLLWRHRFEAIYTGWSWIHPIEAEKANEPKRTSLIWLEHLFQNCCVSFILYSCTEANFCWRKMRISFLSNYIHDAT